MARPIPRPPPVITATLPSRSMESPLIFVTKEHSIGQSRLEIGIEPNVRRSGALNCLHGQTAESGGGDRAARRRKIHLLCTEEDCAALERLDSRASLRQRWRPAASGVGVCVTSRSLAAPFSRGRRDYLYRRHQSQPLLPAPAATNRAGIWLRRRSAVL